jgi:hypothetical protein
MGLQVEWQGPLSALEWAEVWRTDRRLLPARLGGLAMPELGLATLARAPVNWGRESAPVQ